MDLDMTRREMLLSVAAPIGVSSMLSHAAGSAQRSRHLLDRIQAFRGKVNQRGDWVLLRTRTSSGLAGLGDCSQSGNDPKTLALLDEYQRSLRGRSIFSVEELRLWSRPQIAEHGRVAAVALSAIEQSLWELQGQALGVPTYELFGRKLRPPLPPYPHAH